MKRIVAFYDWDGFYSLFTPVSGEKYWNKYKDSSQKELLEENIPNATIVKLVINSLLETI